MTASITIFPAVKSSPGERRHKPATVIILPVVRIEPHDDLPDWPGPDFPGRVNRRSRRKILDKVRQLQEEMLRSPRS